MKGRLHGWDATEQALREWTAAQRAAYALKTKIEKQRWENEVLAPAQEKLVQQIQDGLVPVLTLPSLKELV